MNNKKELILVVDDNLKNLEILAKILREEGYLISLAQDGNNALEQLKSITPDLILLDIMMPGLNGLNVCRTIKQYKNLQEIPIIFVTAMNQTEDLVEGFHAGGVDYIIKPFNRDELLIRVRNHLELASAKQKILELNKNRDKLYSIIAHDIRSPFSNIKFIISSIADEIIDPLSQDFKDIMKGLQKATEDTSTLLNNLLEWTKIQSGSVALLPKLLKVHPILQECISLLSGNARNKDISLGLEVTEEAEAYFDEVTMHTVFRNLISNAIKFTPEGGTIKLQSERQGEYLMIKVADNGVGMTADTMSKLFNKKEHHTTLGTKQERGSGFGLVLIHDFVIQNHGKIEVQSEPGKGSTFCVSIPVSASHE